MFPPWEVDLLQHVHLSLDPAYVCFDLQMYFYAGTNGSVWHETDGVFGWMMSNTEGERAASGMGPARGAAMDSYRAECTGMLSLLRFLLRLAQFMNMDERWRGLIGTDSQSVIDALYDDDETDDNGGCGMGSIDGDSGITSQAARRIHYLHQGPPGRPAPICTFTVNGPTQR